jgi:hypothetical protein
MKFLAKPGSVVAAQQVVDAGFGTGFGIDLFDDDRAIQVAFAVR